IYSQLDFVFGKNPWGISFFHNFCEENVRHLHSQVAFMNGGYLPGGISAGPAPVASYKGITMLRQPSKLDKFNTKEVQFFDDKNDYISNEPTIITNATALFLFLYLQQQAK
ncbi:MAG: glycoside hydrolase family 9 protein, partial [Ignavibacteriales bacterium]|nr:glycoside hydrolase family 9 protein [Ignavibacteriales bacterium]